MRIVEAVNFELNLVYVAVEGKHGGRYTVSVDDQKFTADIETQPKPDSDKKVKYIPHTLGTVRLKPGTHQIVITGDDHALRSLWVLLRTAD